MVSSSGIPPSILISPWVTALVFNLLVGSRSVKDISPMLIVWSLCFLASFICASSSFIVTLLMYHIRKDLSKSFLLLLFDNAVYALHPKCFVLESYNLRATQR